MKQGRGKCCMFQSFLVILPDVPCTYYIHRYFGCFTRVFHSFLLLDYSILLKARHDELIHEWITLHYHELIQMFMYYMRNYKNFLQGKLNGVNPSAMHSL